MILRQLEKKQYVIAKRLTRTLAWYVEDRTYDARELWQADCTMLSSAGIRTRKLSKAQVKTILLWQQLFAICT